MLPYATLEQRVQLFLGFFQTTGTWAEIERPIGFDAGYSIPPVQHVTGRQLFDALHQRVRTRNVIQCEVIMQPDGIERTGNLVVPEQRLELRAEVDVRPA